MQGDVILGDLEDVLPAEFGGRQQPPRDPRVDAMEGVADRKLGRLGLIEKGQRHQSGGQRGRARLDIEFCVLFTAADAFMRDYQVRVPANAVTAARPERLDWALDVMQALGADTRRA